MLFPARSGAADYLSGYVEISDEPIWDGTVMVESDDNPGSDGPGSAVYIDKPEAIRIINHLRAVFGIEP